MADDHSIMREGEGESKGPEQEQDPIRECLNEIAQKRRECRNATPSHKAALWAEIVGLWGEIVYEADTPENQRKLAQAEKAAAQAKEAAAQAEKAAAQAVLDDPDATEEAKAAALEAKAAALEDKAAAQGQLVLLLELQREQAGVQHELARTEAARAQQGNKRPAGAFHTPASQTPSVREVESAANALAGQVARMPANSLQQIFLKNPPALPAGFPTRCAQFQRECLCRDRGQMEEADNCTQGWATAHLGQLLPAGRTLHDTHNNRSADTVTPGRIPDMVLTTGGGINASTALGIIELKATMSDNDRSQAIDQGVRALKAYPLRPHIIVCLTDLIGVDFFKIGRDQDGGFVLQAFFASRADFRSTLEAISLMLNAPDAVLGFVEPKLGNYIVHDRLGGGATCDVFIAAPSEESEDLDQQRCFLKLFKGSDDATRSLAQHEVAVVAALNSVEDNANYFLNSAQFFEAQGRLFVVGTPVCDAVKTARLKKKHWQELVSSLQGLHTVPRLDELDELDAGFGYCHRDVRPCNFSLLYEDCVRLIDFGFAVPVNAGPQQFAGTITYAAEDVLNVLQTGETCFAYEARYDLESLVKCYWTSQFTQLWSDACQGAGEPERTNWAQFAAWALSAWTLFYEGLSDSVQGLVGNQLRNARELDYETVLV